jgi:hypothetical protein
MSAPRKTLWCLTLAGLAISLAICLAWPGAALAQEAGGGAGKGAPDCCPDLSPYYPRNQAAPPAKAKKKKRRAQAEPAVRVDKHWSTAEGQESAPAPAQAPR